MPKSKALPPRCITFDLDDTLWPCAPAIERAERALHAFLAERCPAIASQYSIEGLRSHRQAIAEQHPELRHDLGALRRRSLQALARQCGYPNGWEEEAIARFYEHRNRVELFEGVIGLLEDLRARFRLGVVTNGNADVGRIGIGHLFDFTVRAAEAGAAKPEAGIFKTAIERAGVRPEQIVHVGDHAGSDVRGAAAAGMRTVWVNPHLAPWPGGSAPDAVIRSVVGLPEVLDRWAAMAGAQEA